MLVETRLRLAVPLLCLTLGCTGPLHAAVQLRIYYSALERIVAEQLFTQDGRRYVRGTDKDKCNYAFLEKPKIAGSSGQIYVRARFSGRSAKGWFGRCVGLGDDFDVAIIAIPIYREGAIALKDVRVESPGRDGFYIRRVRTALAESLARQFEYRVQEDAKRLLEAPREKAPFKQELTRFQVSQIRAADDALELMLDFTLSVK